MYYKDYYNSPVGEITIVSDGDNLVGLWIEGQKHFLNSLEEVPIFADKIEVLIRTKNWLDKYFNLEQPPISDIPLAPSGGDFRQRVWKILCQIPYGKVLTYGDIAKQIAKDTNKRAMSAQAVGNAVAHNPISIIIPCHRVIGAQGNLTGYAGGIEKKIQLLKIENVNIDTYSS